MVTFTRPRQPNRLQRRPRRAVTLVEVLVAIFIMGIGLLALLTLFPLGALSLAQSVKDDRAGAIAKKAQALNETGTDLLVRTNQFISDSLINGTDCQRVAALTAEYQKLAEQAKAIEADLNELQQAINPNPKVQKQINQLLVEIRAIQRTLRSLATILSLLDCSTGQPPNDTK